MRRFHKRMADAAELVEPQVVHEDEDDVWAGRLLGIRNATRAKNAGPNYQCEQRDNTANSDHGSSVGKKCGEEH